ncbi:MAG: hypothetical protein KKD18_00750, partial [Nanoarchaeota archaeon]|nr:hypothetical protein [Nanoarchaeota archaeon]
NIADLAESYRISREDLQLSLLDRESARDGRFLSYTTDYSRFIVQRARDLTGNAKFEDLRETDNRFGILESTAFNFRSIRNGYLMICPLLRQNHCAGSGELVREFTRAIDKTESLPRKLACLGIYRNAGEKRYDEVIKFLASTDKTDAVKIMPEVIGEADLSFFDRLEKIRSARTPKQVISGWTQALETFEYLIQGFIQNNPPMELEVRTVL